jgi:chaperonin GroES
MRGGTNIMKVKPLADRVLVKPVEGETVTKGGIYIPQTAQQKTTEGVVVAVGDDKDVIKVKAKDRVMYDKYAGTEVKIGGEDHLIVKMEDILAVLE